MVWLVQYLSLLVIIVHTHALLDIVFLGHLCVLANQMVNGVAQNHPVKVSYRIGGNFRGGFNLVIWRIFPRIAKFKSANIKF